MWTRTTEWEKKQHENVVYNKREVEHCAVAAAVASTPQNSRGRLKNFYSVRFYFALCHKIYVLYCCGAMRLCIHTLNSHFFFAHCCSFHQQCQITIMISLYAFFLFQFLIWRWHFPRYKSPIVNYAKYSRIFLDDD